MAGSDNGNGTIIPQLKRNRSGQCRDEKCTIQKKKRHTPFHSQFKIGILQLVVNTLTAIRRPSPFFGESFCHYWEMVSSACFHTGECKGATEKKAVKASADDRPVSCFSHSIITVLLYECERWKNKWHVDVPKVFLGSTESDGSVVRGAVSLERDPCRRTPSSRKTGNRQKPKRTIGLAICPDSN